MAARRPFWKWRRWKSIGFCLWPQSTCIWNLKLKFQRKLELCSGNHVDETTHGRTDGQGESSIPPYNFVGRGYNKNSNGNHSSKITSKQLTHFLHFAGISYLILEQKKLMSIWSLWTNFTELRYINFRTQENVSEYKFCKMSDTLTRPQCVNIGTNWTALHGGYMAQLGSNLTKCFDYVSIETQLFDFLTAPNLPANSRRLIAIPSGV